MNITRNNYETYFLLYADGELDDAEKKAVEQFITLHPDLAEELDLLLEAVLEPADIAMPGKHLLLKPEEWNQENLTPQQQELLLLLDNELTTERTAEIHTEIEADPLLQREWSILKQSRLTAAVIEMPDKKSLYRRERDRKPVPISWAKWMAAAAVITGIGWYSLSFWNNGQVKPGQNVATATNPVKKTKTDEPVKQPVTSPITAGINKNGDADPKNETAAVDNTLKGEKKENSPAIPLDKTQDISNKHTQKHANSEPAATIAVEHQPLIKIEKENTIASNTDPALNIRAITNPLANQAAQHNEVDKPEAQQTVYNEDTVDETEYVNIAGAHIKKQKLRSIFRNVTRTVSRTFDKSNVAQADVASLR